MFKAQPKGMRGQIRQCSFADLCMLSDMSNCAGPATQPCEGLRKTEGPNDWNQDELVTFQKAAEIAQPAKSVTSMFQHVVKSQLAVLTHFNPDSWLTFLDAQTQDISKQ